MQGKYRDDAVEFQQDGVGTRKKNTKTPQIFSKSLQQLVGFNVKFLPMGQWPSQEIA
jgi:hypothetical protein